MGTAIAIVIVFFALIGAIVCIYRFAMLLTEVPEWGCKFCNLRLFAKHQTYGYHTFCLKRVLKKPEKYTREKVNTALTILQSLIEEEKLKEETIKKIIEKKNEVQFDKIFNRNPLGRVK